ncbi:MAG: rhodanese-like domain-containing protein [Acidobacteriota bacterium]
MERRIWLWLMAVVFAVCSYSNAMALEWGSKEIENEKLAIKFAKEVEKGGYKIVSVEELKGWIDGKKDMLLVDTMPLEDSYKKNHIPAAVQMEFPKEEMTQLDDARKAQLEKLLGPDKDRLIVFYCGFVTCARSHNGAMWAVKLGYKNVYRLPGGIKAWMEADYPIEK